MATTLFLEHYLDNTKISSAQILSGLENLPNELQRNFNLMRDLDKRAQDLMKDIDKMADDYLVEVRSMSPEKRTEQFESIQKMFTKTKEFGDDKVQLAMQTYEMVDKHIRRLDADLARFEAELKDKALHSHSSDSDSGIQKKGRGRGGKIEKGSQKARGQKSRSSDDETPKSARKKQKTQVSQFEIQALPALPISISHPSDVLDMPVDPNEPTYCLCHQVSYGEMIGCDNPDCPIEWFHFACVGLTSKPKGKWYCPKCIVERKKK